MRAVGGPGASAGRERVPAAGPEPLATASLAIQRAARQAHRQADGARRRREVLRRIDGVLDQLETRHIAPGEEADLAPLELAAIVRGLAWVVQGPLPGPVQDAPSSYHLHLALLAWQSDLLDLVVPDRRRRFPDLDSDGDEPLVPAPRSVRRRAAHASGVGGQPDR